MEILFIQLFVGLIFAIATSIIAKNRGRSAVGWFFFGLVAGWIPLVVVLVLPNLKEQAAYRERQNLENMRLREQLRQERIKQESFRLHSAARLDAHDQHLGLDTRQALPAAESYGPGLIENRSGESVQQQRLGGDSFGTFPPTAQPAERSWYYESQGETRGPIGEQDLQQMAHSGHISPENLVWTEGMADWTRADATPSLQGLFNRL